MGYGRCPDPQTPTLSRRATAIPCLSTHDDSSGCSTEDLNIALLGRESSRTKHIGRR